MTESAHPVTDVLTWVGASDHRALALTLWGEARGEPIEGRIAVGCVIRNRAQRKFRGTTVAEVCLWPRQFSCWTPVGGASNFKSLMTLAEALATTRVPVWSSASRAIYYETEWLADGILADIVRDTTHGALYYLERSLYDQHPPRWARTVAPCAAIGHHVFFGDLADGHVAPARP